MNTNKYENNKIYLLTRMYTHSETNKIESLFLEPVFKGESIWNFFENTNEIVELIRNESTEELFSSLNEEFWDGCFVSIKKVNNNTNTFLLLDAENEIIQDAIRSYELISSQLNESVIRELS
ncbi:hypothetical protein [Poseidonibacter ostreae]|uniref:Uncharacterized protein n=1 Tax=Poseidonibacter ostreae TaxID=2654171 RepID=A0A6L4WUL5_9BACT|nr:hypothetical protein [Poseidonibacter ostreae]KAB7890290.1 hypothetical protein GBG19_03400 [Poseidonibacter ostreae]